MKRLILFALLGGLSLAAPAQDTMDNEVRIRGYQIELPVYPHIMFRSDIDKYTGGYTLSNGEVMTLSRDDQRMYARIGNGERKELVAAKDNVFVALDRDLKITLNRDEFFDVSGEVLIVPRLSGLAQAGQVIQLVALR